MIVSYNRLLVKGSSCQAGGIYLFTLMLVLVAICGCGKSGLEKMPVRGTVTFNRQPVADGDIRFVPIEGTKGPTSIGNIVTGQYTIEARGGVPAGKHRVEIRIFGKATQSPAQADTLMEAAAADNVGPPIYNGPQSPLRAEVPGENNGVYDFQI